MTPADLENLIREKLDDDTIVIHDMTDNGGWGLVRWSRTLSPEEVEYVVHRWAVKDTAGNVMPLLLWSGSYHFNDRAGSRAEYRLRDDAPPARQEARR